MVIVYHVLKTKQPYGELGVDYFDRTRAAQLKRYLVKRLENLGLQVTVQSREEVVSLAT
jgi:transposase